jgi:hypothetical protein
LKIISSVIGLVIRALSIAFFFLYLKFVSEIAERAAAQHLLTSWSSMVFDPFDRFTPGFCFQVRANPAGGRGVLGAAAGDFL